MAPVVGRPEAVRTPQIERESLKRREGQRVVGRRFQKLRMLRVPGKKREETLGKRSSGMERKNLEVRRYGWMENK